MYKPLQIQAPQTGNAKNPPLNRPSKYKPPRGLVLGKAALKYKVKLIKIKIVHFATYKPGQKVLGHLPFFTLRN